MPTSAADGQWSRELARFGAVAVAPERASPVQSEILKLTGRDAGLIAAARLSQGTRPPEIQIRRVLAGRYNQENVIAVAVLDAPVVRGTATVRARSSYTLLRWFLDAPWWRKVIIVLLGPIAVPILGPGFVLVLAVVTMAQRRAGIRSYGSVATEPGFGSRFVVDARTQQDATLAVPASLQRALVRAEVAVRLQLTPGRLVLERRLGQPELLEPFVRHAVPLVASAVV